MYTENKFPIKYAILEVKEPGGYLTNYQDIIRGYIVSKCYVEKSSIQYFSNGNSQIEHTVFFPFSDLKILKESLRNNDTYIGEKNIPRYDANNNPYPVNIVSDLFDTYEDAKIKAQEQNKKLKSQLAYNSKFKFNYAGYEEEFFENLDICQLFEKLVLSKTEDMNITHEVEKNKGFQFLKK